MARELHYEADQTEATTVGRLPPGRGRSPTVFRFGWHDLAVATGRSMRTLRRLRAKRVFDPKDFQSVANLLRHTMPDDGGYSK